MYARYLHYIQDIHFKMTINIKGYIFENDKTQNNHYEMINILLLLFSIDNSKVGLCLNDQTTC